MSLCQVSRLVTAVGMAFCISSGIGASEPGMLTADSLVHSPLVAPAGSAEFSFDDSQWWRGFNDPVLDTLVAIGLDHNYDVMSSVARLAQARAAIDAARAGYYPTLSVSAGYTRSRESGAVRGRNVDATTTGYFGLGVDLNWQIDVFGKITARVDRSKASFRASRAELDATRLSVSAAIATAYINLRLLQAERTVANEHLKSQQKVLDMAKARYEAGLGSKLMVAQQATVYYSTLATMPGLDSSIAAAYNALTILLGEIPGTVNERLEQDVALPEAKILIARKVPADLLRRRPDLAAAEAEVAAAARSVGIARKDYLPTLSIEGSVGTSAHNIGDLFSNNSFTYAVAPTLSWTVFDGFGRRAAVADARAAMEAAVDSYNLAVVGAVADVNNAINSYSASLRQIDAYARVMAESKEAVDLSVDLYRGGLTDITDVTEAQINYLSSTNSWLEARAKALRSLVTLYEALGGGWDISQLND